MMKKRKTELSPREKQVAEGIKERMTYREIAEQLEISTNSVIAFTQRIFFKLGAENKIIAGDILKEHPEYIT